ncbi:superoxide dismutase family protein [Pseudomonas matsuisoli]|uniref:Superoxide dismutase [Cu-Zn] n=1 Tax=Pseudomonas matsuisoli TaxID=1515666 RepID=A0A917PIR3_9PSED|nr:superoxide dismutase family protein [Pseudomonas matsuisoli]GGJ80323.1 superoxide dismutase [Cu-Zn] [Pseudomonas matsuisoli]
MKKWMIALAGCSALALNAQAADKEVTLNAVDAKGVGAAVGTVTIHATDYGLVFTPHLEKMEPGVHGFHIHAKGSCEPADVDGKPTAAGAAGGHWDPEKTGKHDFPWGDGHKGDLPALFVTADGKATQPVLAPRIKGLDEIEGLAMMVHAGGDNHSDHPKPLGGGAGRVACGVIK